MSTAISVPDDLYRELASVAARQGQSVEELVETVLREGVAERESAKPPTDTVYDRATDPLMRFAGIGASDDPNWVDEHDRHLGEMVHGDHQGNGLL